MKPVIKRILVLLIGSLALLGCANSIDRDVAAELGESQLTMDDLNVFAAWLDSQSDTLADFETSANDDEIGGAQGREAVRLWGLVTAGIEALEADGVGPTAAERLEVEQDMQLRIQQQTLAAISPSSGAFDDAVNFEFLTRHPRGAQMVDDAFFASLFEVANEQLTVNPRVGVWESDSGNVVPVG